MLKVSWRKTPSRRRREILVPASGPLKTPARCGPRTALSSSPRLPAAAGWLNELITDPTANATSIATRDGCNVRKVSMTISLPFLVPDLVKAA